VTSFIFDLTEIYLGISPVFNNLIRGTFQIWYQVCARQGCKYHKNKRREALAWHKGNERRIPEGLTVVEKVLKFLMNRPYSDVQQASIIESMKVHW